jgi:quercetin dioxygenase-like cupin family protein
MKTHGTSDFYVIHNTLAPGGTTGWHSHPGPSLIFVVFGEVTNYMGDDSNCTPHVYTAGQGFVDAGGSDVHMLRNNGSVPAETVAVQFLQAGAVRRIDEPDPGNCHF